VGTFLKHLKPVPEKTWLILIALRLNIEVVLLVIIFTGTVGSPIRKNV
jgi:hypothetical protein